VVSGSTTGDFTHPSEEFKSNLELPGVLQYIVAIWEERPQVSTGFLLHPGGDGGGDSSKKKSSKK
jgi:hypothetical protein